MMTDADEWLILLIGARDEIVALAAKWPTDMALASAALQLDYLIRLAQGEEGDDSRLEEIVLEQVAVRGLVGLITPDLSERLCAVQRGVRRELRRQGRESSRHRLKREQAEKLMREIEENGDVVPEAPQGPFPTYVPAERVGDRNLAVELGADVRRMLHDAWRRLDEAHEATYDPQRRQDLDRTKRQVEYLIALYDDIDRDYSGLTEIRIGYMAENSLAGAIPRKLARLLHDIEARVVTPLKERLSEFQG